MSYNLTHNNSRKKTMCEKQIKDNQIIKKKSNNDTKYSNSTNSKK